MRLKNINIEERASIYSSEQKQSLKSISAQINIIGKIFDIIVDLENFVIQKIEKSMTDFITVKINIESITKQEGQETYLKCFNTAAKKRETDIDDAAKEWDDEMKKQEKEQYTVENIKMSVDKYKELHKFIVPILETTNIGLEGFGALKMIIEEFVNFRIYKVITDKNIVQRLQTLIDLKGKIEGATNVKKMTIEDL